MITLGISHDLFISSAALAIDGKIVAAIPEERINRQKHYKGFPKLAIKMCLKIANIQFHEIDYISIGWNPARHMKFPNDRQSLLSRWKAEYLYAVPNMLIGHFNLPTENFFEQNWPKSNPNILYFDHQLCHAANAFYLSNMDACAVFSADGCGEQQTTLSGIATKSNGIKTLNSNRMPHSLGFFYSAITQFLGYKPDGDEWKVMAMASYGSNNTKYIEKAQKLISFNKAYDQFYINSRYLNFSSLEANDGKYFSDEFCQLFGKPRTPKANITKRHYDLAKSFQVVFEKSMLHLLNSLYKKTNVKSLALTGGCAMNSVFNGKISKNSPFDKVFISSCPDDSGISVGSALLAYHEKETNPVFPKHYDNFWGPDYNQEYILNVLTNTKLKFEELEKPEKVAAKQLSEGKLIGWFQGRMEFGQRALGNRSILADPRKVKQNFGKQSCKI